MDNWNYVLLIIIATWVLLVTSFAIYFWIRVMPSIRQMRETVEGQRALVKIFFPPRFPRN